MADSRYVPRAFDRISPDGDPGHHVRFDAVTHESETCDQRSPKPCGDWCSSRLRAVNSDSPNGSHVPDSARAPTSENALIFNVTSSTAVVRLQLPNTIIAIVGSDWRSDHEAGLTARSEIPGNAGRLPLKTPAARYPPSVSTVTVGSPVATRGRGVSLADGVRGRRTPGGTVAGVVAEAAVAVAPERRVDAEFDAVAVPLVVSVDCSLLDDASVSVVDRSSRHRRRGLWQPVTSRPIPGVSPGCTSVSARFGSVAGRRDPS